LSFLATGMMAQSDALTARSLAEQCVQLFWEHAQDQFGLAVGLATLGMSAITHERAARVRYGAASACIWIVGCRSSRRLRGFLQLLEGFGFPGDRRIQAGTVTRPQAFAPFLMTFSEQRATLV
jgi:hypothetical protein